MVRAQWASRLAQFIFPFTQVSALLAFCVIWLPSSLRDSLKSSTFLYLLALALKFCD